MDFSGIVNVGIRTYQEVITIDFRLEKCDYTLRIHYTDGYCIPWCIFYGDPDSSKRIKRHVELFSELEDSLDELFQHLFHHPHVRLRKLALGIAEA